MLKNLKFEIMDDKINKLSPVDRLKRLSNVSLKKKQTQPIGVKAPVTLDNIEDDAIFYGYYFPESNNYNIVDFHGIGQNDLKYPFYASEGAKWMGVFLGHKTKEGLEERLSGSFPELISSQRTEIVQFLSDNGLVQDFAAFSFLVGTMHNEKQLYFQVKAGEFLQCETENYALQMDVFSRNTGILESSMMKSKSAIVSGCGSVGSYVALELARSGVGAFLLVDNDTISYSNVCRHQCNIADVGDYKTNAVARRIRLINPEAKIICQNDIIENVLPEVFQEVCSPESIIIGCADNRQGDLFANKIAAHYQIPLVSIGFWERAFAGEIFYWVPQDKDLACYQCFTDALGDISGRQSVNRRFYTTEEDLSKVDFMPGIYADINFVTNVGIKIVLDILNRNNPKFVPRVLDSLTQFTLVANSHKKEIGGEQAEIFSYPLQVTTSIEVDKKKDCKFCGIKEK
jgi:molybdopterin/thiamine biosynthesis adenylyltransferase